MKPIYLLLFLLSFILVACSDGSSELVEELEVQLDQQSNQLGKLEEALTLAEGSNQQLQASLEEVIKQADLLAEANMTLEEEVIGLTAKNAQLLSNQNQTPTVLQTAQRVVALISDQDFVALGDYVHPSAGVRLSPYPYINVGSDLVVTGGQMAAFATDPSLYNWGNYDGSGDPISGNPMFYYNEFIYDHDFANPHLIGWNNPIGSGNMINNLTSIYPSSDYVEFHFTGFNPQYAGMDWSSLTLVFDLVGSDWYLVGIVHGQWTT